MTDQHLLLKTMKLSIIKYNLWWRKISVDLKPDSTVQNANHNSCNVYKISKVTSKEHKKSPRNKFVHQKHLSLTITNITLSLIMENLKKIYIKEVVFKNIPKKQDNQVVKTTLTFFADNNLNSGIKQI